LKMTSTDFSYMFKDLADSYSVMEH